MSTLKTHPCLLKLLATIGLALPLGVAPAGCSSTSGLRTGANTKMKTFLAVGDKPLPVVSGEPGSTVTAEADGERVAPRRKGARPEGRISGRVFDADGRPVPEARVRLAVSGAPGGQVVRASTDRSGAFTLHGLRPGSDYTVIAEWEDEAGVMTGRANARASDTDVRISVAPQDGQPTRSAGKSRVNRVSDREAADDERYESDEEPTGTEDDAPGKVRPAGRVNEEDLPPAEEAEAMAPPPEGSEPARGATSTRRNRPITADSTPWAKGRRRPDPEPAPAPAEPAGEEAEPEARSAGAAAQPAESEVPDDDVPNPLPPAIEPGQAPAASAEPEPESPPTAVASSKPDPFVEEPPRVAMTDPFVEPSKPTRPLAASSAFESPTRPTTPPLARLETTDEPPPGALVVAPETFGPLLVHDAPPFNPNGPAATDPFAEPAPTPRTAAKPTERPERTRRPNPAPKPSASTDKSTARANDTAASPASDTTPSRRRPTWGDVAATTKTPPPFEGEAVETAATAKSDARVGVVRRTSSAPAEGRNVALAKTSDPLAPACEYDDRHRRIIDFRLPDLDGKPVRFQDIDADLVLIDFWGTWCQPCIKSIPHLVDLQERMGKRLAVVGVACEPDTFEKATTRVAETARRLNVNYPVLLSRNDGSCPLQEALHVQAFPTMVLVDREGRVLWRDQGATPTTLARLDHFLGAGTGSDRTVVR